MAYTLIKNITTVNRTVKASRNIKYIVIHYTGNKTDTAKANSNYFKSVNRGSSAHYFVDDKTVYQVVEDKDVSWAVGVNYGNKNLFGTVCNSNSISIEMCSVNGSITSTTFTNTIELTKKLMAKYGIPAKNVYRHYDVCSKQCPGWAGWGTRRGDDGHIWHDFKKSIGGDNTPVNNTPHSVVDTNAVAVSTIKKGDKGDNVKCLQNNLNKVLNSGLVVDGVCGDKTIIALKAFQTKYGLVADGIYGHNTAVKMKSVYK